MMRERLRGEVEEDDQSSKGLLHKIASQQLSSAMLVWALPVFFRLEFPDLTTVTPNGYPSPLICSQTSS